MSGWELEESPWPPTRWLWLWKPGPYNMEIEGESLGGVMKEPTISNAQVNKFSSMYSLFPVTSKHKENSKVQAPLPQLQGSLIISLMPPHLHPLPKKYNLPPSNELILLNYKKTTLTPIGHAKNKVLYTQEKPKQ